MLQHRELRHLTLAITQGTVAPAWSIDQGLLFFDGRFYIPDALPLLSDLLATISLGGHDNMRYLALDSHSPPMAPHHNSTPTGILLGHPWLQGIISSTMVLFTDGLGRQIFHVNILIGLRPDSNQQRLSPDEFEKAYFMFGTMLDLTTTPTTCSNSTIWRRVNTYLLPDMDNHSKNFTMPPKEM
jgi:hypothetical protein